MISKVLNWVFLVVYLLLLLLAIYIYVSYYLCDNENCKAYTVAELRTDGEEDFITYLVANLGGHSIWPLAYIAASILVVLSFWLLKLDWKVQALAIMFLVSFLTVYFMLSFWTHHYLKPVSFTVNNWIETHCSEESMKENPICHENVENIE